MKGTNRKEMRKLLNKYVALMKVAFDSKLNFEIDTRIKLDNNRPWFSGRVSEEGCDFTKEEDKNRFIYFTAYEWRSVEGNEQQIELVKNFIKTHKKQSNEN